MRVAEVGTQVMFGTYVSPEKQAPQDHPLRAIQVIVDAPWQSWRPLRQKNGHK